MRLHGKNGQVEIVDVSPAVVIASLNKWNLNMGRDYVEVTSFGDTNKEYVPGLPDISGSLGGFLDLSDGSPAEDGSEALFDAAEGDTPVTLKLTPSTNFATRYWKGLAYLDVSIDVAVNGAVTLAGNFKAAGPWTRDS